MSASFNALLADGSLLAHGFDTLHKELGSDGHETDGNDDGTEAHPRVGFGFLFCESAFLFLESIRGRWMELESIVFARGIVQEDSGANIAGYGERRTEADSDLNAYMTRRMTAVPLLK